MNKEEYIQELMYIIRKHDDEFAKEVLTYAIILERVEKS